MSQRFSPAITSFSAGEVGPLVYGRTDFPSYNLSLRKCDNWIPTLQGPIVKRRGTQYVASVKDASYQSRLIPYTGLGGTKHMLELTQYSGGTGRIEVYDADGTFDQEINSPFGTGFDLDLIQYAQKEDLLFLVHEEKEPQIFNIDAGGTAAIVQLAADYGPIADENVDETLTMYVSAVTGSGLTVQYYVNGVATTWPFTGDTDLLAVRTIPEALYNQWVTGTAYIVGDYVWSNSYESDRVNVYKCTNAGTSGTRAPGHDFGTEDDGPQPAACSWQMVHSEYGFVRLSYTGNPADTFVNGEVIGFPEIPVDATVIGNFGVSRWSPGLWGYCGVSHLLGETNGPTAVTFHEQRAIFAGTLGGRQLLHGSKIDEFGNFYPGSVQDNAAYKYSINSSENNDIRFLESARSLFIGTENGLFSARASSNGSITPTDIIIERSSNRGAKKQKAVQIGESVLFVQNGGVSLREAIFNNDIKGFDANDLSILAHHLSELGLNHIVFQREPQPVAWTYTNAGVLIGLTYQRENDVLAWHQHNLGGVNTQVLSVAALEDENGVNDKLWMIVHRTINGMGKRYIEIIDNTVDAWSDSYVTYSGGATTTITGLSHLEGETVKVVGDGANLPDEVVASGQIVLAASVTSAVVGLGYTAKAQTQKIEGGAQTGTSQGKLKRIHNVVLRLNAAGPGLFVGSKEGDSNLSRVIYREDGDSMDAAVPPFTGDTVTEPIDQNYEDGGLIYLEHNLPNDCTVIALWPNMSVEDAR